ncbi:cytochrome P450 [Streptomyces prasinus]
MPRPPVPTGNSQADLMERYERDRLSFLMAATRAHGPMVELTRGTVLVNDPAAVHEVLRRTNTDFLVTSNIRRDEVSGLRGDPGTEAWMRGRRATQKGMAPLGLREHGTWLASEAGRLRTGWLERGDIADPVRELEALTARSFSRFCFGTRDTGAVPAHTGRLLDAITPIIASPFHFPGVIRRFMPRYRRSVTAQRRLERELHRAVRAPGEGGLVDVLTAAGLDTEVTVSMLVSNGLASYRVPATVLTWTLVALARHPEIADECAEAVRRTRPGTTPDIVRWVLAESLRLWPPNWLILRTANGEQTCGDWRIPDSAAVMISPYVVHRTAPTFEDGPEEFRPHRWAKIEPAAGEYLPYGMGSRWCIGKPLADLELTTLLTCLVGEVRFTVRRMADRPDVRTTLLPVDLVLKAERR